MTTHSVVQLLHDRVQELPDARAYTFLAADDAIGLTFSELDRRARSIATRLQQLGARCERVLLLYPAGTEYIAGFYGCLAAGAIAVPAYPPRMNRNQKRLESLIEDARPKAVLTTESVLRQIRDQFADYPALARLNWIVSEQIAPELADDWVDPNVSLDTLAFLQYTSASTAAPKGVMVSHGNVLHNQELMKEALRHSRDSVIVSWLPLFHDMGLIGVVLAGLYNAASCYLMAPADFLKRPRLWLEAITQYRGTFSGAPDFAYQLCVDSIPPAEREGLDLSSWQAAFNGSEPVRAETLRNFARGFAPYGFKSEALFPCYGLAEHTLFAAGGFHESPRAFSKKSLEAHHPSISNNGDGVDLVACGHAFRNARLVIAEPETRRRCKDGEVGEIWMGGPSVARGYWNQPELSAETFEARLLDGDGPYLRTGDLGFLHDGALYVTGRIKDLIIVHGRNLIPQDLEQTVENCDRVIRPAFVAAVSVDAGGGERVVIAAEIRREARHELDAEAVITRIRRAVAAEHAVEVSAVVLLRPGTLPKTSSGKTQRGAVRKGFLAGDLSAMGEWRDSPSSAFSTFPAHEGSRPLKSTQPEIARPELARREIDQHSVLRRGEKVPPDHQRPDEGSPRAINKMENWLVARIAERARLAPERVDRNRSILLYGLDSIDVLGILGEIERTFGVNVDIEVVFAGEPTLHELVQRINNGKRPATPPPPPLPTPANVLQYQKQPRIAVRAESAPKPPPREHPFRTCVNPELGRMLAQMGMDKTFVRGEGCWLWDETGRRYLDFLAQYGALPFGFNPPRVWAALNAVQASGEPSFVQPSYLDAAGELARRLLRAAPAGMSYVTFGNSGAEAIEAAIKLCRSSTGRHDILAASNGFHGKTLGALSATDKEKYQKPFGAPVAGFDYVPYGDLDALRRALATGRYAGYIVEPIQGEGGIVEPPLGYLRQARKACREFGTLFVADEVQTGLGRTGAMFACSELSITPDIMTVAKALGGGLMPIGACISTAAVYNDLFACKHTSTFGGNTLACRAGIATLDLLEENGGALIAQVAENGARLKAQLLVLKERYPGLIGDVRGRGYLLGLRFGLDRHSVATGLLGYLGEQEALTALVVSHLLQIEAVRVAYTLNLGGILRIEPPLTVTWEECELFLQALERVLQRIQRGDLAALTAQVTGLSTPPISTEDELQRPVRRPRLQKKVDEGRFAFLAHPLAWKDFRDLDGSLSPLSDDQLRMLSTAIADNFDPMVIGETRVVGDNGNAAYGEFILVPRRAEELMRMPHARAVEEVLDAAKLAQKRGAKIIGLGAYTSVVTQGGLSLKGHGLPALTTGNSYTAVAACQSIRLAAQERAWSLPRRTIGIVGAGGAIGQALSILLSREAGRLVLLGNPARPEDSRQRLLQVAGRIVCSLGELRRRAPLPTGSVASWVAELDFERPVHQDAATLARLGEELIRRSGSIEISVDRERYLPDVDIVVCCTSTTDRIVQAETLRPSAVVCDVSRPSNVAAGLATERPDVMLLDGGVVRMPAGSTLGFNASLAEGNAYACMAETMMMAMQRCEQDASLGFDLSIEHLFTMEKLAEELGFEAVLDRKLPNVFPETAFPEMQLGNVVDYGSARV